MLFFNLLKLTMKKEPNNNYSFKEFACSTESIVKIKQLSKILSNTPPCETFGQSSILYPPIWKSFSVGTKEQVKKDLTVFLDDEDNFREFSKLLPNVYSVQDFFACHKWADIWLDGRVKKWFNRLSDELIIWVGPIAIQFIIKEDECFMNLNSDTTSEQQKEYEVTAHLLLDIAIEEYSKLSFSQD